MKRTPKEAAFQNTIHYACSYVGMKVRWSLSSVSYHQILKHSNAKLEVGLSKSLRLVICIGACIVRVSFFSLEGGSMWYP